VSADFGSDGLDRLRELVRGGLAGWRLSPKAEVALLNVSENATFKVEDAESGRTLAVRVHRGGYHTQNEIASEVAWIVALRTQGVVDTPAPVADRDGVTVRLLSTCDGSEARFAVAFEFVPGREPDSTDDLPAWFRRLGTITARMHHHAKSWDRPAAFARKTWDFDLMFGPRPIWGSWQDGLGLDGSGRALLGRVVETLARRLRRFGAGPDRFGLIHADLRLANLLVDGDLLRVIDFDDCGFSWFAYDFASAVSFFETDPVVPALAAAWVEGYRTVAPLSVDEEVEIPVFVMLRRILLVAWIATHQHSPMGGEVGIRYTQDSLVMADRFLTEFA
jgi:Ser/Thr protein kinase RdoA (MazF antagonist)